MSHIHEKIDWCVGVFCVHWGKVCMIHHQGLNLWLQPGGHIELDETPDQAAVREFVEETGVGIELKGDCEIKLDQQTTMLRRPRWIDMHPINEKHSHICLYYLATLSVRRDVSYRPVYTEDAGTLRWMDGADISNLSTSDIHSTTRWYALNALAEFQAGRL